MQVILFLMIVGLLRVAEAQLTCLSDQNCSKPFCPNTTVLYMCNISVPRQFTRWIIPVQSCGGINTNSLLLRQSAQSSCGLQSTQCRLFQAYNIAPNGDTPCTSSILYVNIAPELNGSLITCSSSDTTTQDYIGSSTILVLASPSAPYVSVTAKLHELQVNCSSGDEDTHCIVTLLINGVVTFPSNNAANFIINGLNSNTLYLVRARAINRCGDYAEINIPYWTLPDAPPTSTITVLQLLVNQSITQLNISWSHVGGNVSKYIIKSVSEMNTFISEASVEAVCMSLYCTYGQIVKTTGGYYTVTISSVNNGGTGPESTPVQAQLKSSPIQVTIGVGVGVVVGVGIPLLLIIIACALMIIVFIKKKSKQSYSPEVVYHSERSGQVEVCTKTDALPEMNSEKKGSEAESNGTITDSTARLQDDDKNKIVQHNESQEASVSEDKPSDLNPTYKDENQFNAPQTQLCSRARDCTKTLVVVISPKDGDITEEDKSIIRDKAIPYYIKTQKNESLTLQDGKLGVTTMSYVPDDSQLWYVDDQPDKSVIIISKKNGKALTCCRIKNEMMVDFQERRGDDSQKWMMDDDAMVSILYSIAMCSKDPGNVLTCVKKTSSKSGIHLCSLHPSFLIPMCIIQEKDDSVLEMKDNEVIISHHMDFTNLGQHWYTYPDTQRRNTITIVSRSGQKVLQPDSQHQSGFAVKDCIPEDEVPKWTLENGSYCTFGGKKRYKVFPMIRNHFLIRFQSYYLTCDIQSKELKLESVNKTMPFDKHLWVLDIQQDGTFTMASSIDEKILLCNKNNAAVLDTSPNYDSQLWRREGHFIKSVKGSGYIGIHDLTTEYCGIESNSTSMDSRDHSRPEHTNAAMKEAGHLGISNTWKMNHNFVITKVMMQLFQIVHKETNFVLSTNDDTSKVFLQPHSSPIDNHLWMLDFLLDGTFLIISNSDKKHVISCDSTTGTLADNQLVTREFSGDKNQLWRFDGGHIESVAYEGQVISLMPTNQRSLCLGNKNVTQSFMFESFTPVYIRCLLSGTVLEVTDESDLKFSTVYEPPSDSQVWYLKYMSNSSFMIISKKNGKVIQDFGKKVQVTEMDITNRCQHWKRKGLYIVSQRKYGKGKKVMNQRSQNLIVRDKYAENAMTSDKSSYFEFQYFAVESYC